MVAKIGKKKLVLIADMEPVSRSETFTAPWGKVWTHGSDVMATWKRFGFKPPSEYRNDYRFKINREGGVVND